MQLRKERERRSRIAPLMKALSSLACDLMDVAPGEANVRELPV